MSGATKELRISRPAMTSTRRLGSRRRPVLYLIVFSAFMLIVAFTAAGQALLVTADTSAAMMNSAVGSDAALVRGFVTVNLHRDDVGVGGPSVERQAALNLGLRLLVSDENILQTAIILPDGTVLAASDAVAVGRRARLTPGFERALVSHGVEATMVHSAQSGALTRLTSPDVIEEYLPIISDGQVLAVAAVWRDAVPLLAQLEESRLHVVLVVLTGGLVSLVLLFFVFRAAQRRLSRQAEQLVEATRRDPLTGALNHGALVAELTDRIEAVKQSGTGGVAVALLDIDNLTSLNDTYGHEAGDLALAMVASATDKQVEGGASWGRYGPDEFLIIAHGRAVAELETTVQTLRVALVDLSLSFDSSERLPLTISAGIAGYPSNGESVTSLLAEVSKTLDAAKASGGDTIRVANALDQDRADAGRFDILQGLIIAVDTKDRYTRRHSEDVARYADFLGACLGLDQGFRSVLQRAGQLHDVGKIGIPETILRKPGPLTAEEFEIVKQHVSLGDLIVRDLPDIDQIRAGIRHHHERWDGNGYLHRLAGEEIPLVARILAVGDAFSAMTSTRPYRKALTIEEALRRLEDAAGSQLDATLVAAFVTGIRTADDPPMPGSTSAPTQLWSPTNQVA